MELTETFVRMGIDELSVSPTFIYPLIQYNLNGKERTFLSSYNSSRESTYKKDSTVTLYYDPETQELIEKKASPAMLVLTVALWIMAVVGIVSVL